MRHLVALLLLSGCATRLLDAGDAGQKQCGTMDLDPSQLIGANTSSVPLHASNVTVATGPTSGGFSATTVDGAADTRSFHLAIHGAPTAMDYRFDIDVTADGSASLDYKDGSQRWLSLDGALHVVPSGNTVMLTISGLQLRADPSTPANGRLQLDGTGTFQLSCP